MFLNTKPRALSQQKIGVRGRNSRTDDRKPQAHLETHKQIEKAKIPITWKASVRGSPRCALTEQIIIIPLSYGMPHKQLITFHKSVHDYRLHCVLYNPYPSEGRQVGNQHFETKSQQRQTLSNHSVQKLSDECALCHETLGETCLRRNGCRN